MNSPTISSRLIFVFALVLLLLSLLGSQKVQAQGGTSVTPFVINCTSGGQTCSPQYSTTVNLGVAGPITINYTTPSTFCSNITVIVSVDGTPVFTSGPLGPLVGGSPSFGPIVTSSLSSGSHTVALQATGILGGCNEGTLASWGGTLTIAPPTYTSDPKLTDFTTSLTYATFNYYSSYNLNPSDLSSCSGPTFTPTASELAATACRVYGGTLQNATSSLPVNVPGFANNWFLATFPQAVSTIVVFPNIDHYLDPSGDDGYDGFQYAIAGTNDPTLQTGWTLLYDTVSVNPCAESCVGYGEPFTINTYTGTAPTSINTALMTPSTILSAGCSQPTTTPCSIGNIGIFTFPAAYQYYAIGASTEAVTSGNPDQELSAFATPNQQLQSGALLTITGSTSGNANINRSAYDSQIHSGTVQVSPCDVSLYGGAIVTDAYGTQGGSPTGCAEGTTASNPSMSQFYGNATISGTGYDFAVQTLYLCNGCSAPSFIPISDSGSYCNWNFETCASPSTGFLAVTNNGPSFTGTLTYAGNSPVCGVAQDEYTSGLSMGQTVVLALEPNSSICGGFTQSQTQVLTAAGTPGATVTFHFGPDEYEMGIKTKFLPGSDYILAGTNNAGGEEIQFTLVPTLVGGNPNGSSAANTFNPGTGTYKGFTIDPYGDLSETTQDGVTKFSGGTSPNLVGAEVYLACSVKGEVNGGDCPTFFDTLTLDYTQPAGVSGAGNALLADNTVPTCPSNGTWNANTILSVAVTETKKKGSNPSSSCFAPANGTVTVNGVTEPAPPIQEGQTFVSYMGFELPFVLLPPYFNVWVAGSKVSAPFTFYYIAPNLTGASLSAEALPIACPKGLPANAHSTPVLLSGTLSNLTNLNPKLFPEVNGLTLYLYDAVELPKGCFDIVFSIANGPSIPFVQQFAFE